MADHETSGDLMVDKIFDELDQEAQVKRLEDQRHQQESLAMVDKIFDELNQDTDVDSLEGTSERLDDDIVRSKGLELHTLNQAASLNLIPEAAEIIKIRSEEYSGADEAGLAKSEAKQFSRDISDMIEGKRGSASIVIANGGTEGFRAISEAKQHDLDKYVGEVYKLLGVDGNRVEPFRDQIEKDKISYPNMVGSLATFYPHEGNSPTPEDYTVKNLTPTGLVVTEVRSQHGEEVVNKVFVEKFSPLSQDHIALTLELDKRKERIEAKIQETKEELEAIANADERVSFESTIRFLESELKVIEALTETKAES